MKTKESFKNKIIMLQALLVAYHQVELGKISIY